MDSQWLLLEQRSFFRCRLERIVVVVSACLCVSLALPALASAGPCIDWSGAAFGSEEQVPQGFEQFSVTAGEVQGLSITFDWGDGSAETAGSGIFSHQYPVLGSYPITVSSSGTRTGSPCADFRMLGTLSVKPPLLFFTDATIQEGDTATANVALTVDLLGTIDQAITVEYATRDGTATAGQDYEPVSGTLEFPPGSTSLQVAVPIIGDTLEEGNESFGFILSNAVNADIEPPGPGANGVVIIDDDARPASTPVPPPPLAGIAPRVPPRAFERPRSFNQTAKPAARPVCDLRASTIAGTQLGDTLTGTSRPDVLSGMKGNDRISGRAGDDWACGGPGDDRMFGGSGDDRIFGGSGADRVLGHAGADEIDVGGDRNAAFGGAGNDMIDARNGKRDLVDCGGGHDTVRADRRDDLRNCESELDASAKPRPLSVRPHWPSVWSRP